MKSLKGESGLKSYCKSHSSFKTRFAIFSLYKSHFPSWFEKLLLSFEYIQLLSLTIFIHPSVSSIADKPNRPNPLLFEIIAYSLQLANPSDLLLWENSDSTTISVLAILLGFTLLKYIMLFYVAYKSYFNKSSNDLLLNIWRYLFKLQGRVLCCFTTSFWILAIINSSHGTFRISSINNGVIVSVSIILIVIEYLLSFVLETQFCNFIPSKQYLSTKNIDMQILTLVQKLIIQIIQLCAPEKISGSLWVLVIINLVLSLIRENIFFKTLPQYNYKSLQYQGDLLMIVLSLHLAHFFQHAIKSSEYSQKTDFRFLIVLWIIFAVMSSQISRIFLKQIYVNLLTTYPHDNNPEILLHKIFATKDLIENKKVGTQETLRFDIKLLLSMTQNLHLLQIFNLESKFSREQIPHDILDQKEIRHLFVAYLEDLALQYPNNSLIKLNLAYKNYKSKKFHAEIIKIISDLPKSNLSFYYTSSALLLHDIERKAISNLSNPTTESKSLNVIKYIETQLLMEDLNNEIFKQIELKKEICNNIIQNTCNLEIIYQNAQIIDKSKIQTQNKMTKLMSCMPDYYLNPLLVLAEYNLLMNYSIDDFHKYYEIYLRKSKRFSKEFDNNDLCEENLYQDSNALLIISLENSTIAYSTASLQTICGSYRAQYKGTHITRLFPNGLRNQYHEIFKEILEKGQSDFTNQVLHSYLSHKEGYLIEADIFIRVHPYINQNLYLDMFIRPRSSYQDTIILNKTGKVEGATRGITKFLGIEKLLLDKTFGSSVYIKQISEELASFHNAFNIINKESNPSPQKKKFKDIVQASNRFRMLVNNVKGSLYHQQAKQIYDAYDSGDKLIPLKDRSFKCGISSLNFKSSSYNLITLERYSYHNEIEKSINSDFTGRDNCLHKRQEIENTNASILKETTPMYLLTARTNHTQNNETEENLVISPSSSRLLLKIDHTNRDHPLESKQIKNVEENIMIEKDGLNSSMAGGLGSQIGSSKNCQMTSLFKVFERAIHTKSYQESFNFLCFIFYGVILLTLICEIVLKNVLDNTMNNLITKTNLLNSAQLRTYHVTIIQNCARGSALQFAGSLTPGNVNIPDDDYKAGLITMLSSLKVLEESNTAILHNIDSESDEIKEMLFQKDIKIIGNVADPDDPGVQSITNFQHADILTHATKLLENLDPFVSEAGYQAFIFVTHNSANDFLAKNQEIIQAFLASLNSQKEHLQDMINLFVIILPILLAGIVLLLSVIIWKQYDKEKRHLLAFLKLNPFMIQHILDNLNSFQRRLTSQEKFEPHQTPLLINQFEHFSQFTSYHKGQDLKVVIKKNMQKRYSGYILKTLFYISLLIIIVIINYVIISKATNKIYRQQRQLQYANDISAATTVSYIAEVESFATNNTNYVMRQPPLKVWKDGIQEVRDIQTNIYKEFQLENGEYDPDIKQILFEEATCDKFIATATSFCNSLKSLGQSTKMFSTLTLYKNMLESKLADYNALDKSSIAVMIGTAIVNLSYIIAASSVTAANAQLINQVMSEKLTGSVDNIYDLATIILIIFSLTLAVVSVLIWFQILTKVKEVNNDFKKVLAVLPPNIILSSFLLKSFLNQTSNIAQQL